MRVRLLTVASLTLVLSIVGCGSKQVVRPAVVEPETRSAQTETRTPIAPSWGRMTGTMDGPIVVEDGRTTFNLYWDGRTVPMRSDAPLPPHALQGARVRVEGGSSDGDFVSVTTMTVISPPYAEGFLEALRAHGLDLGIAVERGRLDKYIRVSSPTSILAVGCSPPSGGYPPVWLCEGSPGTEREVIAAVKGTAWHTVYRYKGFVVVVGRNGLTPAQLKSIEAVAGKPVAP